MSLGPVGSFPHLSVCVLLMLPGPGRGVRGGRRCLISGSNWTCSLDVAIHSFAYLEILLSPWLKRILKGEKFHRI